MNAALDITLQALQKTLEDALAQSNGAGRALFSPFVLPEEAAIRGTFEVRNAQGDVRRLQDAVLPLPRSLFQSFCLAAPNDLVRIEMVRGRVTLWPPTELIELQVGYRWHGFSGKPLREWDDRFVVFAEEDGDPLALRIDEDDGPVWIAPRGEGRHHFVELAPNLAAFYETLAASFLKVH